MDERTIVVVGSAATPDPSEPRGYAVQWLGVLVQAGRTALKRRIIWGASVNDSRDMKTVEITYRYGTPSISPRPRPSDAESARVRLSEGNQRFAALLANWPTIPAQ